MESQNNRCRFAQRVTPLTRCGRVEKMMMVIPINGDVNEAQGVTQEDWDNWT